MICAVPGPCVDHDRLNPGPGSGSRADARAGAVFGPVSGPAAGAADARAGAVFGPVSGPAAGAADARAGAVFGPVSGPAAGAGAGALPSEFLEDFVKQPTAALTVEPRVPPLLPEDEWMHRMHEAIQDLMACIKGSDFQKAVDALVSLRELLMREWRKALDMVAGMDSMAFGLLSTQMRSVPETSCLYATIQRIFDDTSSKEGLKVVEMACRVLCPM